MELEMHSRWSEYHRNNCEDCYSEYVDACSEMNEEALMELEVSE